MSGGVCGKQSGQDGMACGLCICGMTRKTAACKCDLSSVSFSLHGHLVYSLEQALRLIHGSVEEKEIDRNDDWPHIPFIII